MGGSDKRQTQDERPRDRQRQEADHTPEEYTAYPETRPEKESPEDAAARREADLQPATPREGEP